MVSLLSQVPVHDKCLSGNAHPNDIGLAPTSDKIFIFHFFFPPLSFFTPGFDALSLNVLQWQQSEKVETRKTARRRFTGKMGEESTTSTTKSERVCENTQIPHAVNLNASANFEIITRTCSCKCKD